MAAISGGVKLESINAPTFTPLLSRVEIPVTEDTVRHLEFRVGENFRRASKEDGRNGSGPEPRELEEETRETECRAGYQREGNGERDTPKTFID